MSNTRKIVDKGEYVILMVDGESTDCRSITLKEGKALARQMIAEGLKPNMINGGLRFYPMGTLDEYVDLVDLRSLGAAWKRGAAPARVMADWNPNALAELREAQERRAE